jgi:ComF family protein
MLQWFNSGVSSLQHLLFPNFCTVCEQELVAEEAVLCLHCAAALPRTHFTQQPHNTTFNQLQARLPLEKASSLLYFTKEGMVQPLLHALKYQNRPKVGHYLGALLGQDLKDNNWLGDIDGLIPVPLHPKKEKARGYNQSVLIAEGIEKVTQIPLQKNLIKRVRNTSSQTQKTRIERVHNMQEVFALQQQSIPFKHILIIDDVLTTGATLEACALALLSLGSIKISIATIAIAIDT